MVYMYFFGGIEYYIIKIEKLFKMFCVVEKINKDLNFVIWKVFLFFINNFIFEMIFILV